MMDAVHHLVDTVTQWITHLGHWGIMLGLMIEIIPSEIVLAFGGYLVSTGDINFWMAVIFGVIGGTIAQIFVYWVGRYGGRPFLERYGKYIFITKHHIDLSENWFKKYGAGVIFTARFVPVVRHAISIPAGIVRMPLLRFTVLTTLAIIPWSILFVYLGKTLGENWETIDEKAAPYVKSLMWAAIAAVVLYVGYKLWKRAKTKSFVSGYTKAEMLNTERVLKDLGPDYRLLHGRQVHSGSAAHEIAHLVVGPNGVFHIENKAWSGEIGLVGPAGEGKEEATAQSYRYEFVLKELLREKHQQADVVGIICFTHPDARLQGESPSFVALKPDGIVPYILGYKPKYPLEPQQVAAIADLLEQASKPSRR